MPCMVRRPCGAGTPLHLRPALQCNFSGYGFSLVLFVFLIVWMYSCTMLNVIKYVSLNPISSYTWMNHSAAWLSTLDDDFQKVLNTLCNLMLERYGGWDGNSCVCLGRGRLSAAPLHCTCFMHSRPNDFYTLSRSLTVLLWSTFDFFHVQWATTKERFLLFLLPPWFFKVWCSMLTHMFAFQLNLLTFKKKRVKIFFISCHVWLTKSPVWLWL